jgi:HD-GYP domain-containing protein (c-di-GMP phosphodiesterase class II)
MAPVIMRDPLVALDLGLSPIAHRFVAMLDRKDPVSRDHVIRVGEMAVRSGERAGLRGTRLRNLGLAALLHDIGKLEIPEDILTKPGALTEEESAIMRTHPAIGERLMLSEPELAPAATFVRLHHERNDGRGYPDGKRGAEIPVEVGIISAADAFDAMCHTRPYREGMGQDRALAILREHAGSQWSEVAVAVVVAAVESGDAEGSALDDVGRSGLDLTMGVAPDVMSAEIACGCADAIPEDVRHLALTGNSLR